MSGLGESGDERQWQPATSKPGEVFTDEGQIRSIGAFARGAVTHDVRLRAYRRSMWLTGLVVIALGVAGVALVVLAASLVG
jgi:hypothetical protein